MMTEGSFYLFGRRKRILTGRNVIKYNKKAKKEAKKDKKDRRTVRGKTDMKYVAVILGIFGIEFGIKEYVEKNKTEGITEKRPGSFLLIRKHHNRGAVLNMGENRRRLVAGLSVALTVFATIVFGITLSMAGRELLKWGLALLLGGAYSNTYDRLVRKYVVDYVSFDVPIKGLRRIIFNIGDFCIMIGALLCVLGCEHP